MLRSTALWIWLWPESRQYVRPNINEYPWSKGENWPCMRTFPTMDSEKLEICSISFPASYRTQWTADSRTVCRLWNCRDLNIQRGFVDDQLHNGSNDWPKQNKNHCEADGRGNNLRNNEPFSLVERYTRRRGRGNWIWIHAIIHCGSWFSGADANGYTCRSNTSGNSGVSCVFSRFERGPSHGNFTSHLSGKRLMLNCVNCRKLLHKRHCCVVHAETRPCR